MSQPPHGYGPPGPGYGPPGPGYGPPNYYAPPGYPPPQKSGGPWAVLGVIALVSIPVLGILAALGIYGVRRYIASAKSSEAKNTIGAISRGAVAAYDRDGKLCESAGPVPTTVQSAKKYQPAPSDWNGFACLKFSMTMPHYYQYAYTRTGDTFVVTARGDLDGDGIFSEFTQKGTVSAGRVVLEPQITVTNEFE